MRLWACAGMCAPVRACERACLRAHALVCEHVRACSGPHAGFDGMMCICMFIKEKSVEQGAGEE